MTNYNATAFRVRVDTGDVMAVTAVVFADGRITADIATPEAEHGDFHAEYLRVNVVFAGKACRVVVIDGRTAYDAAMAIGVRKVFSRMTPNMIVASYDKVPDPERTFTKRGQACMFDTSTPEAKVLAPATKTTPISGRASTATILARCGILMTDRGLRFVKMKNKLMSPSSPPSANADETDDTTDVSACADDL